jgi:hypothetical protein
MGGKSRKTGGVSKRLIARLMNEKNRKKHEAEEEKRLEQFRARNSMGIDEKVDKPPELTKRNT